MSKRQSFTLFELVITTVILAIIVGLAIPNYVKSAEKTEENNAIINLKAMRATIKLYLANTGNALIPNWNDLDAINTALGLDITDSAISYNCVSTTPEGHTNECLATHTTLGWRIHFHGNSSSHNGDSSLHCMQASPICPSCPVQPGDCG